MITNFVDLLTKIIQDEGFEVWFGSKNSYLEKREINNLEVIIEPFEYKLTRGCTYEINLRLWVGIRRNVDERFTTQDSGANAMFIDYVLEQCNNLFDKLQENEKILIYKNKEDVVVQYFEGDTGTVANTQSFGVMTLPIHYYA